MDFLPRLDAAAGAATCQILNEGGSALVGYGAVSLAAGGTGFVPLTVGAVALLASRYGCTWDPNGTPASGGSTSGCMGTTDGSITVQRSLDGAVFEDAIPNVASWTRVDRYFNGLYRVDVDYVSTQGESRSQTLYNIDDPNRAKLNGRLVSGTCGTEAPPNFSPFTYTDPDNGCQINVEFQGFAQEMDGVLGPVFRMSPAATQRAGGSIIGGCNFEPTIYYGGPKGPGIGPWNPIWIPGGPGYPLWADWLGDFLGGLVSNAIYDYLKSLFEAKYPAGSREIHAACENKEDGTPETFSVNYPEETFNDRVLTSLNAIVDFQQQILLWRTPICKDTPAPQTGEPVTINWISDNVSMVSGTSLRKIFTYFDHSGSDLAAHVAHWRDFTWNAGPLVVSCVGTQLGKPQVWASDLEEAKRVIGHAASIAAVDISDAQWLASSPKSARYGVSGLMRVHRSNGVLGITKRDGPSGMPIALP